MDGGWNWRQSHILWQIDLGVSPHSARMQNMYMVIRRGKLYLKKKSFVVHFFPDSRLCNIRRWVKASCLMNDASISFPCSWMSGKYESLSNFAAVTKSSLHCLFNNNLGVIVFLISHVFWTCASCYGNINTKLWIGLRIICRYIKIVCLLLRDA